MTLSLFRTSVLSISLLATVSTGCSRRYSQPEENEPHATVEVRVIHRQASGPELEESVTANRRDIAFPVNASPERMQVMRIRPELTEYEVNTRYFHTEYRQEQYWVNEQYQCGSTWNGRTMVPSYCSRSVPRMRTVPIHIDHGTCEQRVAHTPQVGGNYILQYEYQGPGQCTIECVRQMTLPNGQFQMIPCGDDESYVTGETGGEIVVQPAGGAAATETPAADTGAGGISPMTTTPAATPQ